MEGTAWETLSAQLSKFSPFNEDELELLRPHLSTLRLKKGDLFAAEGKVATSVGLVLSGSLRHFYTRDGLERTTYFYFENHLVGAYISCITGQASRLSIEALTDCELAVFPYAALKDLFARSHAWERFGRKLAEYLAIGLEERMVTLLLLSPEERYRELLNGGKDKIIQRIPQYYIASYLGITPVSLSRIRNRTAKR